MSVPTTGSGQLDPTQDPVGAGTGQILDPVGTGQIQDPVGTGQILDPVGTGQIQDPVGTGQIQDPVGTGTGPDLEPFKSSIGHGLMFDKPGQIPADQMTEYPERHPNSLVALATGRIVNKQHDGATRETLTLTALVQPQSRFILVLDALAALAISEEIGQVVAVGAKIDGTHVAMTVAENTKLDAKGKDVQYHLQDLLDRLHKYSTANGPVQQKVYLELSFFKTTYIYSITQMVKRFTKYSWLKPFAVAIEADASNVAHNCKRVMVALLTLSQALSKIEKGGGNAVNEDQWGVVMFMMSGAIPCVEFLHGQAMTCEDLATSHIATVNLKKNLPKGQIEIIAVPLLRALEKLTSHHRHVLNLFRYATSPEGHGDLISNIKVDTVSPDLSVAVELPAKQDWQKIIKTCFLVQLGVGPDAEAKIVDEEDKLKSTIGRQFKSVKAHLTEAVKLQCWVHCECCLIAHFNQAPPGTLDPKIVPYIGVSKLSCAACYAWIRASNQLQEAQYHTRGCHHRWYPHWAMPVQPETLDEDKTKRAKALQHYMNKYVGEAYEKFVNGAQKYIALSDSTVTKTDFPAVPWAKPEMDKLDDLCKEWMDKWKADAANGQQIPTTG